MKSILTHTVVAILAIILTSLFMRQCTPVTTVTKEITTIDTLYKEKIVELTDTIYRTITRVKHDTITRVMAIPFPTSNEGVYSYDEYYQDSSYQVRGDILYKGKIEGHSQQFIKRKDNIAFIPTTRTIFRDREIIKSSRVTRQPRLLAGGYLTGDRFSLQQAGVKLTYVDNKFRQFSLGKDVLKNETWYVGMDIPLFYSKFR